MRPTNRQRALISRDGRCWLCNQRVKPTAGPQSPIRASVDHVLEKRNGGWDDYDNYRLAHGWCNSIRAHYPNPYDHPRYNEVMKTRLKRERLWRDRDYVALMRKLGGIPAIRLWWKHHGVTLGETA